MSETPVTPPNPYTRQDDEARRIALLRAIAAAGGTANPVRNAAAEYGYEFAGAETAGAADLKFLAQRDYLQARFFDRVTICPVCSSHHLNIREICPNCKSTHYVDEPLLHHFRCGYVGRISEFAAPDGSGKRICPKCTVQLKYLGTDYDQLGKTFLCVTCGTSFQDPPVSASCLNCGTETPGGDLSSVEISRYALTSLGSAALRRGALFEAEGEILFYGGLPIYRQSVMREVLDREARRIERFKGSFSLMIVDARGLDAAALSDGAEERLLEQLLKGLRGADVAGQLADRVFAIGMPQTRLAGAKIAHKRHVEDLNRLGIPFETRFLEIAKLQDLEAVLKDFQG